MNIEYKAVEKELIFLEFRLSINRRLYDEGIISLEVYQKMENYLITKKASKSKRHN